MEATKFISLLFVSGCEEKTLFFYVMWNKLAVDDGWPRAVQACKGNENKMLMDEDKRSSKAKEDMFVVFGFASIIDRTKSRAYRSE